jgi:hypothetical protein
VDADAYFDSEICEETRFLESPPRDGCGGNVHAHVKALGKRALLTLNWGGSGFHFMSIAKAENSLLSRRGAIVLCLVALVQAAVACFILIGQQPGVPLSGMIPAVILPQVLCGLAVILAVVAGPFLCETRAAALLPRAMFAAMCQTLIAYFYLLVCTRLEPLETDGLILATLWIALMALIGILLPALLPRAYPGIVFCWLGMLPVMAYMIAEAVLSSPSGGNGWHALMIPEAGSVHGLVRGILAYSPGTAAIASLSGVLADGSEYSATMPLVVTSVLAIVLSLFVLRRDLQRQGQFSVEIQAQPVPQN